MDESKAVAVVIATRTEYEHLARLHPSAGPSCHARIDVCEEILRDLADGVAAFNDAIAKARRDALREAADHFEALLGERIFTSNAAEELRAIADGRIKCRTR